MSTLGTTLVTMMLFVPQWKDGARILVCFAASQIRQKYVHHILLALRVLI